MGSWKVVFSVFIFFVLVSYVSPQTGFVHPSAGEAYFSGKLVGSFPGTPVRRYGVIPQTSRGEWDRLNNSFTVEFWMRSSQFENNPTTGVWNSSIQDEYQFYPILNRHPQNGAENEYSQFHFQLTRTANGPALVAWSGCGCVEVRNPRTCGYGYLLSSDSRLLPENQRSWIVPETWYHVAVSFDGDDTTPQLSRTAKLYINGNLVFANTWGDPSNNNAFYKDKGLCIGKAMVTNFVGGSNREVRLGYLQNQDTLKAADPTLEYGFYGSLDEVRLWKGIRSAADIKTFMNIAFIDAPTYPSRYPGLVGYYRFNDMSGSNFANSIAGRTPLGTLLGEADSVSGPTRRFFSDPYDLSLGFIVYATALSSVAFPTKLPGGFFQFSGFNNNLPVSFRVVNMSTALAAAINAGVVNITSVTTPIKPANLPTFYALSEILYVASNCADPACGAGNFENLWLEYVAFNGTATSTSAKVFFVFGNECSAGYDSCGVCGGDDSTCSCVFYNDFRNSRMVYILLQWTLEQILNYLNCSIDALAATLDAVKSPAWNYDTVSSSVISRLNFLMNFYNECLTSYCGSVSEFSSTLGAFMIDAGFNSTDANLMSKCAANILEPVSM